MTDFQELIQSMQDRGHSLGWIGRQLNVNVTTLSMIKNTEGRQPRYDLGKALVELELKTRP